MCLTEKQLKVIDEIAEMLTYNIVQGRLNERGNYGTVLLEYSLHTLKLYFIPAVELTKEQTAHYKG